MKSKQSVATSQSAKQAAVEAVVVRCGCGDPDSHSKLNRPCPNPRQVENKGTIAYYHRNPIIRMIYRIFRAFGWHGIFWRR